MKNVLFAVIITLCFCSPTLANGCDTHNHIVKNKIVNTNTNTNINENVNTNTNLNTNENTSHASNSVTIVHPDDITTTIIGAPGVNPVVGTEIPVYVGPYQTNWNDQSDTILPYLLSKIRVFTVNKNNGFIFWHRNYTKSDVSIIADNDGGEKPVYVRVFVSISELDGLNVKTMATITTHGNRKVTTMDCFNQALVDTSEVGGNAFLLLRTSSDPGIHSSTLGLGGSGAGNFVHGGPEAFSGGAATGFSSNTGGPVSNPYIHGIALRISE